MNTAYLMGQHVGEDGCTTCSEFLLEIAGDLGKDATLTEAAIMFMKREIDVWSAQAIDTQEALEIIALRLGKIEGRDLLSIEKEAVNIVKGRRADQAI